MARRSSRYTILDSVTRVERRQLRLEVLCLLMRIVHHKSGDHRNICPAVDPVHYLRVVARTRRLHPYCYIELT
jgi:hypothetical protein